MRRQPFRRALPVGAGGARAQPLRREKPARPKRTVKDLLSRVMARVLHHGAWKFRHYECAWSFVQKELASTVRVPWRVRPFLWRRGFLGESWVLYNLGANDWRNYLPDYARFTKTRLVNGAYASVLDNKLIFHRFFGDAAPIPRVHGILNDGAMILTPEAIPENRPPTRPVLDVLHRNGAAVLKPLTGGGGRGLAILRLGENGIEMNGASIGEEELYRFVASCHNYMLCEHVAQHEALARLYPRTTNTLRLLTIQDDSCDAFVAAAVLRMGAENSGPTDNWSRGGLSAKIDVESGRVGPAVGYPAHADRLTWHAVHPANGRPIDGFTIPHWQRIAAEVLATFRAFPLLKYVGWDVIVTEDGFRILEGNNYSDVNLLQVHGPLLTDERTRVFYRRHGVL